MMHFVEKWASDIDHIILRSRRSFHDAAATFSEASPFCKTDKWPEILGSRLVSVGLAGAF